MVTGGTPSRNVSDYFGGSVPWLKPSDLISSRLVETSEEYLSPTGASISRPVPSETILVSCIGTIGEVAIAKVPLCFNQQINALVPNRRVLSSYLYWACVIKSSYLRSIAAKTAVPILNKSDFSRVPIPLPSLQEQRTIATMLDSVDDAREQSTEETHVLRSLKASAADALLTGGIRILQEE